MIRSVFMLLAIFAVSSPAFAGDNGTAPLVKGTKFYQSRVISDSNASQVQNIEPAAGVEIQEDQSKSSSVMTPPAEDYSSEEKKPMKLHGKK
ncbi:MAG: hypothetical protein KDJ50_05360 [Alphaproteobacteria bacterium]|nr:hypothetical protein [Alphaproteobacteria bacterium]